MNVVGHPHVQGSGWRIDPWIGRPGTSAPRRVRESGQATVELALLLPLVCALLIIVLQVGLVVRSQVLLVHLTREMAREAALGGAAAPAVSADVARAAGLVPERLDVVVEAASSGGGLATVRARYRQPVVVPLLGILRPELILTSQLTVRSEQ